MTFTTVTWVLWINTFCLMKHCSPSPCIIMFVCPTLQCVGDTLRWPSTFALSPQERTEEENLESKRQYTALWLAAAGLKRLGNRCHFSSAPQATLAVNKQRCHYSSSRDSSVWEISIYILLEKTCLSLFHLIRRKSPKKCCLPNNFCFYNSDCNERRIS